MSFSPWIPGAVLAISICAAAQTQVAVVACSQDAAIYAESGSAANGSGEFIYLGANSLGDARRSFVRFDVAAAIPAGSIVAAAELAVNVSQTNAGTTAWRARRVLASWPEGPSNPSGSEGQGTAAGPGDVTWTMRDFGAGAAWATAGGELAPDLAIDATIGGVGPATAGATTAGVADVQAWLDQPASNCGWCLLGDETAPTTSKRIDSRHAASAAARPALRVTYFPPGSAPEAYCPLTPNSAGAGATIGWSGSTSHAANAFTLTVAGATAGTSGVFFFGSAASAPAPFADGNLCVRAPLRRLGVQVVDASGSAQRFVDLTSYPGTLIAPRATAAFQFWFRDVAAGGAGSNLSNALLVPFHP